mmetsp:Transcript_33080/g.53230  ORF Transcript_33080/g.53230 Transcript_33080/m.53230 type:complete len:367 (+) Transcript_33080:249-1349(+)
MRAQAGGEHACAPWPPGVDELGWGAFALRSLLDEHVLASVERLLLSRVRDLRHRGHLEVWRLTDAAQVAVTHRIDGAVTPHCSALSGLLHHLQVLVEVDPATPTRALVRERALGHEVVRGLHADANVGLVRTVWQLDLLPEVWVLGVELAVVELLDAARGHVLGAVVGSAVWQGPQAAGQEVDDRELDVREEVVDLCGPLHADEASAHHQDGSLLLVQRCELVVLLQDVPAAALDEALVNVLPVAHLARLLVDGREPQGFAHGLEGPEVAACADDAVLEGNRVHLAGEHGLDGGCLLLAIQLLHLTPDELHAHLALQHGLQGEGQRVQVRRLHEGAKHTGRVLEVLLSIDNRDIELLLQLTCAEGS